jgi:hypothetical protein
VDKRYGNNDVRVWTEIAGTFGKFAWKPDPQLLYQFNPKFSRWQVSLTETDLILVTYLEQAQNLTP